MSTVQVEMGPLRGPSLRHHVMDFANMLKAFIGSNYLTIAFAFRQSGIALGLAGLVVIASLTAHCCQLLVKCKYHAIKTILSEHQKSSSTQRNNSGSGSGSGSGSTDDVMSSSSTGGSSDESADELTAVRKKLQRNMNYGDIGRLCMGKLGLALVNVSVMITQFGFCVGYCIFIGNTVQSMFPLYNCSVPVTNTSVPTISGAAQQCLQVNHLNSLNAVHVDMSDMTEMQPGVLHSRRMLHLMRREEGSSEPLKSFSPTTISSFITFLQSGNISIAHPSPTQNSTLSSNANIAAAILGNVSKTTDSSAVSVTHDIDSDITTVVPTTDTTATTVNTTLPSNFTTSTSSNTTLLPNISTTTSVPMSNVTKWSLTRGKHVPDLKLLVLSPVLIFIGMTLIRDLRQLGSISFIANAAIFVGCVEVLAFLISGFSLSSTYLYVDWRDMPIFFGMVTSAFEGIGTILPIESSMEGNRHNFVKFLYGAIGVLTCVLSTFGILGYLRFGDNVEQMINANIPSGQWLGIAVNACLCVGVLLTFPLMMYPVVELTELYLFGNGRLCGPQPEDKKASDHQSLLPKKETTIFMPVAEKVSNSVPAWKRNILRAFIVLCAGGLAVLLRNNFAYISAFVGALGSTMLAYILPCLFHLKLCWSRLPLPIKVKDITIIVIGICCGVAGVYAVLLEIISSVQ